MLLFTRVYLWKWILFVVCDVVEELASRAILHDQEKIFRSLNNLVHLNEVRVANELKDMDLPADPFNVRNVDNLLFL